MTTENGYNGLFGAYKLKSMLKVSDYIISLCKNQSQFLFFFHRKKWEKV